MGEALGFVLKLSFLLAPGLDAFRGADSDSHHF